MAPPELARVRAFLIDLDGTLYLDERLLPGARALIDLLDERGQPYLFVTNNSSRRGEDYRARLHRLGVMAPIERVMTSGDVAIEFLLRSTPHRSAYVVGTPGLVEDVRAAGIRIDEEAPDCVLLGYDSTLTYAKLEIACRHIFFGKPYYATHPDRTCITQRGLIPDIAAIIAACEAVTTIPPTRVLGKPSPELVEVALRRLGSTAETTAMVGDQLDTDLSMAQESGLVGVLVMTGETTPAKLAAWPADRRPTIVARGMDELVEWLR